MSGCQGCSYRGISTAIEDNFVGVRFGEETNLTLCSTGGHIYGQGDEVVVELKAGPAYARVERSPMPVFKPCQKSAASAILRRATLEDRKRNERKLANEQAGKLYAQERAKSLGIEMKVTKAEFALDGRGAKFFFTADGRVDFRRLVKDLSQRFATKVRMVQLGSRDEAALVGGIGVCGRTLCCSSWMQDFRPISIQMAKRQNLSLNPSKISGQCGRLLCCLAFEDDQYQKKPSRKRKARDKVN